MSAEENGVRLVALKLRTYVFRLTEWHLVMPVHVSFLTYNHHLHVRVQCYIAEYQSPISGGVNELYSHA